MGGEFHANTYTSSNQIYSSVTALNDGGFVVTWSSDGQDGSGYGIYGQRYAADGTPVGGEFHANTYTSNTQIYSSVTALNDGGFVVTWSSDGQDGSGYGIYGQRYAADGTPVGSEFAINQITAGDQFAETFYGSETVATLADGHLVQVWAGKGGGGVLSLDRRAAANTAPTAVDDTAAVDEDATVTGNVLTDGTDDSDPDGDALSVSAILAGTTGTATAVSAAGDTVVSGAYGTLTIHANGKYSYAADADILDTLSPGAVSPPEIFTYTVSDGNGGTDTATLTINVTALNETASQSGAKGNDILTGDTVRAETEDTLRGDNGNDALSGLGGADTLYGGNGDDLLFGGSGRDTLYGEKGNDVLNGSAGNDTMDGGQGNDMFIFGPGFGNDQVLGFDADPSGGQDFLDISALGITSANFAARVVITDVGADTLVTIDGNAAETIRLIGITHATTVTQDDFFLL